MGFGWLSGSAVKNGQKRGSTATVGAGGILPVPAMKN
jgi:hypothetical protein